MPTDSAPPASPPARATDTRIIFRRPDGSLVCLVPDTSCQGENETPLGFIRRVKAAHVPSGVRATAVHQADITPELLTAMVVEIGTVDMASAHEGEAP